MLAVILASLMKKPPPPKKNPKRNKNSYSTTTVYKNHFHFPTDLQPIQIIILMRALITWLYWSDVLHFLVAGICNSCNPCCLLPFCCQLHLSVVWVGLLCKTLSENPREAPHFLDHFIFSLLQFLLFGLVPAVVIFALVSFYI